MHIALRPVELARHALRAGCAQLADAPAQIRKLQALGEMAVSVGGRRLRRKVDARLAGARRTIVGTGNGYAPMASAPPRPGAGPATSGAAAPKNPTVLPIAGYDELTASQVAGRLVGLSAGELDAVAAYEAAHRARKTVLAAVERQRRP